MSVFKNMVSIKDRVKTLLIRFPHLRDDDNKLLSYFWFYEVGEFTIESLSAQNLLEKLNRGELTASESIRRVRQKLQEEYTDLRGFSYKARKKESVEVKQEIKNL
jgi:hypothetical protein